MVLETEKPIIIEYRPAPSVDLQDEKEFAESLIVSIEGDGFCFGEVDEADDEKKRCGKGITNPTSKNDPSYFNSIQVNTF